MSSYGVAFSRLAEADLDGILDYIAKDNPVAAIAFIDELRDISHNTLGTFPKGGSYIAELDVWFHPYGKYIIVYDLDEEDRQVIVHMVSHSARQWRSIFAGRIT